MDDAEANKVTTLYKLMDEQDRLDYTRAALALQRSVDVHINRSAHFYIRLGA